MRWNRVTSILTAGFLLGALAASVRAESAGGLSWTAPAGWKSQPKRMRAANYVVPAAGGDSEAGECGVYFFGPGQGGSIEANVQSASDAVKSPKTWQ